MRLAGRDEHLHRGGGEVSAGQAGSGVRHPLERSGGPDVLAGRGPSQAMSVHEPRRRRQVPVAAMRLPAMDLRQPAKPFRLDRRRAPLQFGEVRLEGLVRCMAKVLRLQLIQRGPQ